MEFPFLFSFRARDVRNQKHHRHEEIHWNDSRELPLFQASVSSQELGACPPLGYWDPFGMMAFQDDDVRKYMGKTDWCRSYYEEGKAMHSRIELFLFVQIVFWIIPSMFEVLSGVNIFRDHPRCRLEMAGTFPELLGESLVHVTKSFVKRNDFGCCRMTWTHDFESINAHQCGFLGLLEIRRNWRWLEDDMKMTQQDGLSNRHVIATSYLIHPAITLYLQFKNRCVYFSVPILEPQRCAVWGGQSWAVAGWREISSQPWAGIETRKDLWLERGKYNWAMKRALAV